MGSTMKKTFVLLLLAGLAPLLAYASTAPELTLYNAAKVEMPTLGVPVGVRAVGMGEAYAAAGGDVTALHWNPAGLARIGGYQLGLMHNEWNSALGLRQEYLAYGMGLGTSSGFGVSANYFSLGTLTERSDTGALGQESGAFAFAGTLGYATSLLSSDALKLGLSAEFGMESLFKESNSVVGGGVGLQYDITRDFTLGAALNHLGAAAGGFSPPSEALFGAAYAFNSRAVILAVDGSMPFNGDPAVRSGVEVNLGSLSLRGGWRQSFSSVDGSVQSGPTAGAGFKAGVFAIDYAFVPYGDLSTTHRVSAMIDLPDDFFRPKILGAESSTITARAYYDKAIALEKSGSLLQALIEFQRAKDAYPEKLRGKPQNFYLSSLKKIESIQKDMNKSGNNEQVRKLLAQYVNSGQDALRNRRYKDAISNFRAALKVDAENKDAKRLLDEAQEGLRSRKKGLLEDADTAYRNGQLGTAVERYREVLAIDESDEASNSFFGGHKAEIQEFLRKIHRKGIDQYVAGNVKEAIDTWRKGLKLDPADPINFRRDIDKAQKLLDLRGGR
jgi:tetratricopeptide (TPR) repeat protein